MSTVETPSRSKKPLSKLRQPSLSKLAASTTKTKPAAPSRKDPNGEVSPKLSRRVSGLKAPSSVRSGSVSRSKTVTVKPDKTAAETPKPKRKVPEPKPVRKSLGGLAAKSFRPASNSPKPARKTPTDKSKVTKAPGGTLKKPAKAAPAATLKAARKAVEPKTPKPPRRSADPPKAAPTPKPPRRSAPATAEPPPRNKTRKRGSKRESSGGRSDSAGPIAPPRTGAGIKRSVTARQSTSKPLSNSNTAPPKSKVCKHPSLEMERSVSSESCSSNNSVRSRTPTNKPAKQVPGTAGSPTNNKRAFKRVTSRTRPNKLDLSSVRYSEPTPFSPTKEDYKLVDTPTGRNPETTSKTGSVLISPSELLLNQSLHEKLAQNESNRHGFILTDTDMSIGGSSEYLNSISQLDGSDSEILFTPTDLILGKNNTHSTISSSDLMSTDHDTDYDEVADCTPVQAHLPIKLEELRCNSPSILNNLSNTSSRKSSILNITLDEKLGYTDDLMAPQFTTFPISGSQWSKNYNAKLYNSPDDNFHEPSKDSDKDLYYDSSDLGGGSSTEEMEKLINTPDDKNNTVHQNMSTTLKEKMLSMDEKDIDIKPTNSTSSLLPASQPPDMYPDTKDQSPVSNVDNNSSSSLREFVSSGEVKEQNVVSPPAKHVPDVLSPLRSETSDPLGTLLAYSSDHRLLRQQTEPVLNASSKDDEPEIIFVDEEDGDDSTVYFRRENRSIRPGKRRSLLVRSSSFDKKFLTQPSTEEGEGVDDIYIVQTLPPRSTISISNREFLSPSNKAPVIRVTPDDLLQCVDSPGSGSSVDSPGTPRRRFILRSSKNRNTDLTRRFSETQVFKHHKEKYMKRKEVEEKYNSCPVPTTPDLKIQLESPNYIRGLVKRVSSMLTPNSKPRIMIRSPRARDSFGSTSSVYFNLDTAEQTRGPHQDQDADSMVSVNRSNSFDFDDPSGASFRRSADNDSIDHPPLVTKAKSISDHLDRFRLTVNNDNGAPELSCQDWRDLLPQSTIENLDKKDEEQQHLIWELITTERNYIQMLSTVINTLLGSLRHLQSEKFLTKIEEHNVYLNMEKIRQVHLTFWHQCIEPLISTVRDTGELLNPEILASGCNLFEEELNPLFEYVMTYIDSKSYIKTQQTKNSDFKEYINWCSNEIRRQYNKLDLDDVLIKPIQRIQKYPILLKDILRKTTDEDTRSVLTYFLHKVREFVELLNSRKEEKEEQQKIDNIQDRIDGYNLNNTPTHTPNEQLNQILNKYCKFDLTERVPLLNTQRKFIHESHCKMSTVIDGKSSEAVIFIFSDLILVTRPNKNKKNKNKIIKQPLSLDKIEVEELKDYTNTTVFVYSNEYGSLVEMFLLQSVTQESHNTMLNFINQAKDNYTRDKTKFYTEMDISKTSSITSTDPSSTDLPIPRHQPVCGITRSSSEHYPPARRILLDTSSSVSRAQSMPASNDKRNLVPPKISSAMSSSSSSSSSSGSSSSGSSGLCMDLSRNHTTLPTMDENMRPEDPVIVEPHGNENVISNNNTVQILPVKNIDDVYISENLSSEIKGKLDLEKKFEDEKVRTDDVIFQRSDTIFINHGGDRESKS